MGIFADAYNWLFGAQTPAPEVPRAPVFAGPVDMADEDRPVIAISASGGNSKSLAAMVTQVVSAGGTPLVVTAHSEHIKEGVEQAVAQYLARADALIIMGNDGDIDPAKYGQAKNAATNIESPERAAYEEAAIQKALQMKMPLIGVCGGMQRINVLGGGTLLQHVPDIVGDNHHQQGDTPPYVPVQLVTLEKDSKLLSITGTKDVYTPRHGPLPANVLMENSFHHQAVNKVRDDFIVAARSDDGIIEAIEPKPGSRYDGQFVEAVQWHPEFSASDFGPKLASRLTSEARNYAATKERLMGEVKIPGEWAARMNAQRLQSITRGGVSA